jgi:hypothetical protein
MIKGNERRYKNMKKVLITLFVISMLAVSVGFVMASWEPNRGMGKGWVPYAYIEVTWDGSSANGDWHVYDPNGNPLTGCDDCLEMEYEFTCVGNTLLFTETYVEIVPAFPQTHQVVLLDNDRDRTYIGSITARYEWPLGTRRMDIIDYEITVNENCEATNFFYTEYEYKQQNDF